MKSQLVDGADPISILSILPALEMACNTNETQEVTAMWLFHIFMKKPVKAALNACTCLSSSSQAHKEGGLTSYCHVVKYLLATYGTDDIIAEAEMDMMNVNERDGWSTVKYAQALSTNALRCSPIYDEHPLKDTFIAGSNE